MENVLKKITNKKKERVERYKKVYPINDILKSIKNIDNYFNFKEKIKKRELSIIAEIKKASPTAGIIKKDFNHLDIAKSYVQNGAEFLSVLTEEDFFLGKLEYIKNIKKNYPVPILCKDFFLDTYQIPLAKSFGADCILIILSAIDEKLAKDLYQTAKDLNISTLIEVHTVNEEEKALYFEDSIIGINNRNLENLKVSLNTTIELSKILDQQKNPLVCESGINSVEDIEFIIENCGIYNFLIGESLLKSKDIGSTLKKFTQISV